MLPTKTDIRVSGDLGGEKVEMRLDADSTAHLMSLLTDLYSDPLLAVIREYSTNAWDSHVAAGITRPIEVTTPNYLTSTFRVKDYGLGMDANDIREIYSSYGASTKRATNDMVGMLGLGSKSGLTYTDQFNVIGIKNGIKTSVAVSRSGNGGGVMEIIDQSPTSDPNGVEIIVPIKKHGNILTKAEQFFRFWEPGRVLLNGKEPNYIWGNSTKVGKFYIINDTTDYVVMGNVAYPVKNDITGETGYNRERAVVKVDIGDVAFTPSRESLQMTLATRKMLESLRAEFAAEVVKTIEAKLAACNTYVEAYKVFRSLKSTNTFALHLQNATFRGIKFIDSYKFDWVVSGFHRDSISSAEARNFHINGNLEEMVIVHGFEHGRLNSLQKKKIKLYLEDNGLLSRSTIVLVDKTKPDSMWFSECHHVDWKTVRTIKLESARVVREQDTWDVLRARGSRDYNQLVDGTRKTLYASGAEINADADPILDILINNENQFLLVGKNRQAKFLKNNPKAIYWLDEAKTRVLDYISNMAQDDIKIIDQNMNHIDILSRLHLSRILDPNINTLVFQDSATTQHAVQERYNKFRRLSYTLKVPGFPERSGRNDNDILDGYPMLTELGWNCRNIPKEHIYAYMNAVYSQGLK